MSGAADLIESLVELGLTITQSRVYLSLLDSSPASAIEIAQRAGVPRTKVYAILEEFQRDGFCSTRGDRVRRHEAVPPEVALTSGCGSESSTGGRPMTGRSG